MYTERIVYGMLRLRKNHPSFNPRRQRSPVGSLLSLHSLHPYSWRRPLLIPRPSLSLFLPPAPPPLPLSPRILEFTSLVAACTSTTHQEAPGSKRVPIFSHPLCPSVSLSSRCTPSPLLPLSLSSFSFTEEQVIHTRIEPFHPFKDRYDRYDRIDSGRIYFIYLFILLFFFTKEETKSDTT